MHRFLAAPALACALMLSLTTCQTFPGGPAGAPAAGWARSLRASERSSARPRSTRRSRRSARRSRPIAPRSRGGGPRWPDRTGDLLRQPAEERSRGARRARQRLRRDRRRSARRLYGPQPTGGQIQFPGDGRTHQVLTTVRGPPLFERPAFHLDQPKRPHRGAASRLQAHLRAFIRPPDRLATHKWKSPRNTLYGCN